MQGIATLSMYDWPETSDALDCFWLQIRNALTRRNIEAPEDLCHIEKQMPLWTDPNLVVGQTCGWPYANHLRGTVVPFARFDYGLEQCPPGMYQSIYIGQTSDCSRFIENAEALENAPKVAINGDDSQSGFHVFSEISGKPASLSIPEKNRIISGAHRNSVKAVAEGRADIAAIDAVAFELAKRYDPEVTSKVEVLGASQPKPGLPLITSNALASRSDDLLAGVTEALDNLDASARETLMIRSVLPAKDADYSVFKRF